MKPFVEISEETDVIEDQDYTNKLIVFNDDVNTFEHVIVTLINVCRHSVVQAEQCAYIIHTKGKCSVKEGSFESLTPLKSAITDAGIGARID